MISAEERFINSDLIEEAQFDEDCIDSLEAERDSPLDEERLGERRFSSHLRLQ